MEWISLKKKRDHVYVVIQFSLIFWYELLCYQLECEFDLRKHKHQMALMKTNSNPLLSSSLYKKELKKEQNRRNLGELTNYINFICCEHHDSSTDFMKCEK